MFEEVAQTLEAEGATARKMFGHRCLMVSGKGFAVDYHDDIVIKLDEPDHARAMALEDSHLFEPMAGRPMKQWVQVSPEHAEDWLDLARAGMEYVDRLNS
ncbi:MAG TPA: TfoX/Sxy family protein [Candidatus Saccharimonadales bacterium]|nr:TfoX/Sxy family protein [Candidatus Saccharimonadales bacterium]